MGQLCFQISHIHGGSPEQLEYGEGCERKFIVGEGNLGRRGHSGGMRGRHSGEEGCEGYEGYKRKA